MLTFFPPIYSVEVLATLTSDVGRILSKLHRVQPEGTINLLTGIRIAHVSWKLQLALLSLMFNEKVQKFVTSKQSDC
jgi:hypothetical protein